ncbi:hypothetical protein C5748_13415 [Phyllobacterium phragmitis]|uniref:Uncharacterized protein n=1 Tax=Phyllobacterium phragmitis TaxID=2670329 RepID=A0A2S9IRP0_9HYPH|nr:hypothetical protein C5748_13415 [Phyllobacterium phragmitis]
MLLDLNGRRLLEDRPENSKNQQQGRYVSDRSLYSIGPKIGIDFRKARCADSITYSVLCAS